MAKLTASNSSVLANIKRQMNHKIYARALEIINSQGEEALREYMGQFFRPEYREENLVKLFGKSLDTEGKVKSLREKYSKAMSSNGYDIRRGDLVSWRDSGPGGSGRWLEGTVTGVDSATVEIELDNGDVYIVQPRSVSVSARETRGPR